MTLVWDIWDIYAYYMGLELFKGSLILFFRFSRPLPAAFLILSRLIDSDKIKKRKKGIERKRGQPKPAPLSDFVNREHCPLFVSTSLLLTILFGQNVISDLRHFCEIAGIRTTNRLWLGARRNPAAFHYGLKPCWKHRIQPYHS